jgi:DNA repair exonuclease SbcCD nuclease subunit
MVEQNAESQLASPAATGPQHVPVARVLLVADTHLGFDLPFRPRINRRRRGHDFFANFERALQPALRGEVDVVVHGGDLFYRSKVPTALVDMALEPLVRVAEQGVPLYVIPGNHERSRIPQHLWTAHPNIHIFDEPRTYLVPLPTGSMALSGFPFHREGRATFRQLVKQTGYRTVAADAHLLCIHLVVEGAQVGVSNYTFRSGPHVVRGRDIPEGFAAVLSGHIHRAQVLTHDLAGRPLAAPVIYPGSVERTSIVEREEEKGYVVLDIDLAAQGGGALLDVSFVPLPARPMVNLVVDLDDLGEESLTEHVRKRLLGLDSEAVVRVQLEGSGEAGAREVLSAACLRGLAPPSMNVSLAPDRRGYRARSRRRG